MFTIFTHALRKSRGTILGWGLSLVLLGAMIVPVYTSFAKDGGEAINQLLETFPKEMLSFMGDISDLSTLEGYLSLEYFAFMPIILGIFAISAGSGLIANDEENGTLDLIAAHPVSRSELFFGRVLAYISTIILILALAILGIVIPVQFMEDVTIDITQLITPFLSLFAFMSLVGTAGLALSLFLPSKKMASMVAGIAMIADFFIQGFARINDSLKVIADVLPLKFYQGNNWADGLELSWFLGLLSVATLFTAIAWWRFLGRDIRVGGEGSWQFPNVSLPWKKSTSIADVVEASGD